jgi:phosphatidylserine decarboxylase
MLNTYHVFSFVFYDFLRPEFRLSCPDDVRHQISDQG